MAKKTVPSSVFWQKITKYSKKYISCSLKRWLIGVFIIVLTIVPRFWRLNFPPTPYFDEPYHLGAVRLIARHDSRAYEWWHQLINNQGEIDAGDAFQSHDWLHPPVAKLIQAVSIGWFQDNAWGWRLPSAVAGSMLIGACYLLAKQIARNWSDNPDLIETMAVLSCLLMAFDGLVLVQSRIMMNDILMCLWLVLMMYFLSRWQPEIWSLQFVHQRRLKKFCGLTNAENLIVAGLFLGLAVATKWSALFPAGFFFLLVVFLAFQANSKKILPLIIFSLVGLPIAIYIFSYGQMFAQGKNLNDWWQLHQQIWWYQTHRQEGHIYASKPFEWLFNLRPVWYWTDTKLQMSQAQVSSSTDTSAANIYALGNPLLHTIGLFALVYGIKDWRESRANPNVRKKFGVLLLAYFSFWLPWVFSPRVMFYYHYLPALPLLSVISARFLVDLSRIYSKKIMILLLFLIGLNFILFLPNWLGMEVPLAIINRWYLALPSWR